MGGDMLIVVGSVKQKNLSDTPEHNNLLSRLSPDIRKCLQEVLGTTQIWTKLSNIASKEKYHVPN